MGNNIPQEVRCEGLLFIITDKVRPEGNTSNMDVGVTVCLGETKC